MSGGYDETFPNNDESTKEQSQCGPEPEPEPKIDLSGVPSENEVRDYFAGQALSAMDLSSNRPKGFINWIRSIFGMSYKGTKVRTEDAVESAYDYADAMLEEKEKRLYS